MSFICVAPADVLLSPLSQLFYQMEAVETVLLKFVDAVELAKITGDEPGIMLMDTAKLQETFRKLFGTQLALEALGRPSADVNAINSDRICRMFKVKKRNRKFNDLVRLL